MSVEIVFHPKGCPSRNELRKLLIDFGFEPTTHLWNWPEGSLHFRWYNEVDYQSFNGVEATIFTPSEEMKENLGDCVWALHTRTRASASPADKNQQNNLVRGARAHFGGNFYNDWFGRNRYTKVDPDPRDAAARGIYLGYELVTHNIHAVQFALPNPVEGLEQLAGTKLDPLSEADPTRVLYNALVPFAVAAFEHFFTHCFKVLLRYDSQAQERLKDQSKKVELTDVLSIQSGAKKIEDVVADWYSFQNINSVHKAFQEWFGIDIWKILRRKKKIGRRLRFLDVQFKQLIDIRHGVIHRFLIDRQLRKEDINEVFDLVITVIDIFVDHLEHTRGKPIRD